MNLVERVRQEVKKLNEEYIKNYDSFNFWESHIKYVVHEALVLAERFGADKEIVELGALLHDIALISHVGTKADHHINGVKIADEILTKLGCPVEKKSSVLGCVLHHRNNREVENLEEVCVADADIIAHYDNIPMCFEVAFRFDKIKNMNDREEWIAYFSKDFNDLSEETAKSFKPRYDKIMESLFPKLNI